MKIVETGDPGILELRANVLGCMVFVGLLFFVGGGFGIALVLDKIPIEAYFNPELKQIGLVACGFFIVLGLVFMGGRSGKIFDRREKSLTTWSGLFVPMRRTTRRLDGYTKVSLLKEVRRSKNSSTTFYPVRLENSMEQDFQVELCLDYFEGRRLAEAVAKVLHVPLSDSTSGEEIVREPDRLDESLRNRMRRLGERVELPPRPHTMCSEASVTSSEVVVDFPGMSTRARLILYLAIVGGALVFGVFFVGAPFITEGGFEWVELVPFMLFAAIPMVVFLVKIRGFNRSVHVTANRVALKVVEGGKITEIPGDELEELSIQGKDITQIFQTRPDGSMVVDPKHLDTPKGSSYSAKHGQPPTIPPAFAGVVQTLAAFSPDRLAIIARSDQASVSFGRGLEAEEIAYLYSAIMKVMVD